ncbi:hypothetical protein MLD38_016797 [Melastoma candidum]|uniref:Uncharacterized protein n=1 Tax=Melastoma candidum TaxID=119954 RepID=A0ACB9QPR3_9MYRT|nr:hypothetical protein MLD38_016797 [Melastoma candidum]
MVCEKCEKKLSKVIVPDKWKEGASNTTEGGGRKINENKLLSKKSRWTPYGITKCTICKQQVHQDANYHLRSCFRSMCNVWETVVLHDEDSFKVYTTVHVHIRHLSLIRTP